MMSPDWLVFKDFLDTSIPEEKKNFSASLDEDISKTLGKELSLAFAPSKGFDSLSERLRSVHYSWFLPFFDRLTDGDKYVFISVFDDEAKQSIMKYYDLTRAPKQVLPLFKSYIEEKLYHFLTKDESFLLPKSCLPHDPLNLLLDFSRKELLTLVDYLSMHDLSLELKTMISSSQIRNIETLLPLHQKQYLKVLSQKIEPISFKPMGLSHWDGNEKQFKKILHQRGLNRLSKALTQSNASLLWHIVHKLDIGRATIVKTLFKEVKNKKAQKVLVTQICDIMDKVHLTV